MELLESYLKAVKRYLPRGQRHDIIAELSEELRSQLEDRRRELGRALSDDEQMVIFKQYGDPMIVARRYRQKGHSLTIGWELIGPELFPMYLIILGGNILISVGLNIAITLYLHQPISFAILLRVSLLQVACVTLTFIILNLIRGKFQQPWYYPPAALAPMIPVARLYSTIGLALWSVLTLWWMAVPYMPHPLFGSAAGSLRLAPSWDRFYLPIFFLLAIGIAQRAINVARPAWSGLLPASRLFVNAVALGLQYPMIKSYPYVLAAASAKDPAHAVQVANTFNGVILWGLLSWLWAYHLIGAAIYAWYCAPYIRRLWQRKESRVRISHELNGLV